MFKANLLIQVGAEDLFDNVVSSNPWTWEIAGTVHLSEGAISTGTDIINLPSGIDSADVTFSRISTGGSTMYFNDLLIRFADEGGSIQISNRFASSGYQVETLHFYDTSTIDLTALTSADLTTILTDGDDDYNPGYVFSAGFATITISSTYHADTNVIEFIDLDPADNRMWTDYNGGLHLQDINDTSHSITISAAVTGFGDYESDIGGYLQEISFDDETTWT